MRPAIRSQGDSAKEHRAHAEYTTIDTTVLPDLARQEFVADTNVNNLLKKFGVGVAFTNGARMIYGDADYATDLQQALGAIAEARAAHVALPDDLKRRYPTWQRLLEALETGELKLATDEEGNLIERPEPPSPESAPSSTPPSPTPEPKAS